MEKLSLFIILIVLVDFNGGIAVSYNRPKFSPCAAWNPNASIYDARPYLGGEPNIIFVTINDTVYITSSVHKSIVVWQEGTWVLIKKINYYSSEPLGLFATANGDVYIGTGNTSNQVDKWASAATSAEIVMNVTDSCYGLFIDINNTLYCSMQNQNKVITKSLNSNVDIFSIAAGSGSPGNGSYDLDQPLGIFVDTVFRLYVADRNNNRIQRFDFGQLNGSTIAGSAAGTISLNKPTSIVLDADNNLFIVDSQNRRIIGPGPDGFRCLVGCNGSVGTSMIDPQMLSFDSYGSIFVTDKAGGQVHQFFLSTNYCNSTQSTQYVDTTAVTTTMVMNKITSIKPTILSTMMSTYQTEKGSTLPSQMQTTTISKDIKTTTAMIEADSTPHSRTTCNISNTTCDALKPCQFNGICVNNKSVPDGYICHCPSGFNGSQCQLDIQPCKPDTCWNNGTCLNKSLTEFLCICVDGWTDAHCETKVNYCQNITCQNQGVCRPLFRDYQCDCSSSSYSGRHCEITSSSLIARKFACQSVGYIAIICICTVIGFVVLLDVLKYFFHIDPVHGERERLRLEKVSKKKKPPVIMRFKYIHESPPSATAISMIEETV